MGIDMPQLPMITTVLYSSKMFTSSVVSLVVIMYISEKSDSMSKIAFINKVNYNRENNQ